MRITQLVLSIFVLRGSTVCVSLWQSNEGGGGESGATDLHFTRRDATAEIAGGRFDHICCY